jgi:dTDP-4-dehydrorhamnose 3,5-epimerase-like enzyme
MQKRNRISIYSRQPIFFSKRGVIRGLHLQISPAQAKLVRVLEGEILDGCRFTQKSPTFEAAF